MPNSWNEFTSEFQRLASRKLTERRIESILEDLHEHVDAAKCDPEFAGKSDREIESIVVARLGAPSDIIAAEQDSHRVAWLPVWVATAGLIWCASWLIAGHRILTLQMLPWGIYGTPIAVLLATLAGRRSKLWALLGATFGVALAMTIVLAFTWLNLYSVGGTGYLPRWQVDSATKEVQTLIDRQTTELRALEKAKAVYDRSDIEQARLLTYVAGKGWKAPSGSSSWPEVVEYQFGPTFASAAKIWKSRTGRALGILTSSIRRHQADLRSFTVPGALNPIETTKDSLPSILGVGAGSFVILGLSHAFGLAIVELPRRIRRRRWQKARQPRIISP